MAERNGIITLTTDFGVRDPCVGIMKGVILGIFPEAKIVDLSHLVPPQDINAAAWLIRDAYAYFPKGSTHLVVVDPGVGSERRAIALLAHGHFFVGPDNGVFTAFFPADVLVELNRPSLFLPQVSSTFHGRDVFAPIAARIAKGLALTEAGPTIQDPVMLTFPEVLCDDGVIKGEVIEVDLFGNLITNIPAPMVPDGRVLLLVDDKEVMGVAPNYSALANEAPGGVIGSHGRIEIALKNGNASEFLDANVGAKVEITAI